ncbi:MAG: hypothetical protein IPF54_17950 [Draconibacterium sp.]|nr:hypothetical protein [Draconibacterium sp.]
MPNIIMSFLMLQTNGAVMQVNEEEDFYKVTVYSSLKNGVKTFHSSAHKNNVVRLLKF